MDRGFQSKAYRISGVFIWFTKIEFKFSPRREGNLQKLQFPPRRGGNYPMNIFQQMRSCRHLKKATRRVAN